MVCNARSPLSIWSIEISNISTITAELCKWYVIGEVPRAYVVLKFPTSTQELQNYSKTSMAQTPKRLMKQLKL